MTPVPTSSTPSSYLSRPSPLTETRNSVLSPTNLLLLSGLPPEQRQTIVMKRSFKTQIVDYELLAAISFGARILSGNYPRPEIGPGLPKPFPGTRDELIQKVQTTVYETARNLEYNRVIPFLQTLELLSKGKTFREIKLSDEHAETGGVCVGWARVLWKILQAKHNVHGMLSAFRQDNIFIHSDVIVECRDGYVELDPLEDPQILSIPFEQTQGYKNFSITASKPGSLIPLTRRLRGRVRKCCVNVANTDDLILKHAIMDGLFPPHHIRISSQNAVRTPDTTRKQIVICINESLVVLKDNTVPSKTEEVPFKEVLEKEFFQKLSAFIRPTFYCLLPSFHTPAETLHRQIVSFIPQTRRIQELFNQTILNE